VSFAVNYNDGTALHVERWLKLLWRLVCKCPKARQPALPFPGASGAV
jgi:hypothetical protein